YVPIDQSIPTNRIQHIIEKVSPQFLINTTDTPLNYEGVTEITVMFQLINLYLQTVSNIL
ncbi:hypothetical protein DD924_20990, partial [Staphylococcus pseudintermedius]